MRAKLALAIAAVGLMLTSQASQASDLMNDVHDILFDYDSPGLISGIFGGVLGTPRVLTQQAVVANSGITYNTSADGLTLREMPIVLAPTSTGTAIITQYPSDLDIRREDLSRRLGAIGPISGGGDMAAALAQVGCAEVQMRSDGLLDVKESRRLYRAMDRIGVDLQDYTSPRANLLGGLFSWL